jgi:hypothetical protein
MYGFYLGYNNKLSIEFICKYPHLYSIVFMSARKKVRIPEFWIRDIQPVVNLTELFGRFGEEKTRFFLPAV